MDGNLLVDGPAAGPAFLFAHGAGAGMDAPFMNAIATGLAQQGVRVVRFEFPYMIRRRESGKKSPPDRQPKLLAHMRAVIATLGNPQNLVIGGKSMGGRIASYLAAEKAYKGLICMGYPFHPPGKPEKTRIDHLGALKTPTLILQGTRDPFGNPEDVKGYGLPAALNIHWLEDGDHGLKPRKRSGRTEAQNLLEAVALAAAFVFDTWYRAK